MKIINPELVAKIKNSDIFNNLKHAKNYFFADVATRAISLISIPVFTALFTPEDYGIISIFLSYVAIFTILLSLNLHTAIGRYYYEKTKDFKEFLGTSIILVTFVFFTTFILFLLFHKQLSAIMQLPGVLSFYLILACLFGIIYTIYRQILVPRRKSKEDAKINVLKGWSNFIIALILVLILKEYKYLGVIWAGLITGFIFSIYFLIKMSKYSKISFNPKHVKYILTYSLPLMPYALSSVILTQFDRIMIGGITSTAAAGIYSLGYNIGMILLMVIGATLTAFVPDFMEFVKKKEYIRIDNLVKKTFSIVLVAAFCIILFSKELILILVAQKFHAAISIIAPVVIGYIFYQMFYIYGSYLTYLKKTIFSSVVVLTAGIINILLNAIFIPKYGYIAAAYTTLISYFVMFVLAWFFVKIMLKQRVTPLKIICWPLTIMFSFTFLFYLFEWLNFNFILLFVIKLILLMVFITIIFHKQIRTISKYY